MTKFNRKSELEESNWGRKHGWFIEYENKIIGELVDFKSGDMFWFNYKIIAYNGFEEIVLNNENWEKCIFKYRNKFYPQYANQAFSGISGISKEDENLIISMRGLHLETIE